MSSIFVKKIFGADSKKDHTFFRIKKQIEFCSFFMRQIMRNLHPDHSAIYTNKQVQKVAQICLMGNGTLEQILPGLPPRGYGGSIRALDLAEGFMKDVLQDPWLVMETQE